MRENFLITIKIQKLDALARAPQYAGAGAAGADLHARLTTQIVIPPLGRQKIPTGLAVELPEGFEAQVRPRSGLAFKYGVTVLNAPGTIDSDYRGELAVLLVNLGPEPFIVKDGDRIAQLIISPVVRGDFVLEDRLSDTDRGSGGFGSTGI